MRERMRGEDERMRGEDERMRGEDERKNKDPGLSTSSTKWCVQLI